MKGIKLLSIACMFCMASCASGMEGNVEKADQLNGVTTVNQDNLSNINRNGDVKNVEQFDISRAYIDLSSFICN